MTISTESTRVEYTGNGSTLPFAVPYKFLDKTDLVVVLRTILTGVDVVQTIYTHYTVLGAGDASGTVTFVTAPASTQKVVIYNDPPLTQLVDYIAGGSFPAETHEEALDRLTIQQKRTREISARAILLPDADTDGSGAYDAKSNRIKNLGTPTATTDAVTKTYTDVLVNNTALGPAPTGLIATGSVTSRLLADRWGEVTNVKDFGAVGDGATNDTTAFQAAAAVINANDGGTLVIPEGTYIVGRQTLAGSFGQGGSWLEEDILKIENCTKSVQIIGYGAILKADPTLRFGSFHPETGAVHNPTLPFLDLDYRADAYWGMVELRTNTGGVSVLGLEFDGNDAALVLGGVWGSGIPASGERQIAAYGLYAYGNHSLNVENVYSHHHMLDGIVIGYNGLVEGDEKHPHSIKNSTFEYNARQGLSWVGGNGLTVTGCSFNHTGHGAISSPPKAGIDIEAENSVCRNGVFINCELRNNKGSAMVASTGDVADCSFSSCTFVGVTNYCCWPNKPGFVFRDSYFHGSIVNQYGHVDPTKQCSFERCVFSDEDYNGSPVYTTTNLLGTSFTAPTSWRQCEFYSTTTKWGRLDNAIIEDCYFHTTVGTDDIANKQHILILWGATLKGYNVFESNITTNPPADAYYIGTGSGLTYSGTNTLVNTAGTVYWQSWSPGAGGILGNLGGLSDEKDRVAKYIEIHRREYDTLRYGSIQIGANIAAPASGTYEVGDITFNEAAAAGGFIGWVCVVAGTPGTWQTFGTVVGITALANDATPTVAGVSTVTTGGTTTITDFDDGVVGQTITVLSEHAITITDATNIILNGSADFVMASADTLTLVLKADGKWYETARMKNLA